MTEIIDSSSNNYTDGDIVLLHGFNEVARGESYLIELIIMAYCIKGKAQFTINGKELHAEPGDLVICPPKTVVENIMISPESEVKAVGISYEAAQRTYHTPSDTWDILNYLIQHPIVHLDADSGRIISAYYDLVQLKMRHKDAFYHKEIMRSIFNCLYRELCSIVLPLVREEPSEQGFTHGNIICRNFFTLLAESEGRERSVATFADKLCITPKYLSTVIKEATGQTAINWAHQYAMREIERQLKYTDKSIKEISDDMNFPNMSFFGKFVKSRLGVSPTQYRKRLATESSNIANK